MIYCADIVLFPLCSRVTGGDALDGKLPHFRHGNEKGDCAEESH